MMTGDVFFAWSVPDTTRPGSSHFELLDAGLDARTFTEHEWLERGLLLPTGFI